MHTPSYVFIKKGVYKTFRTNRQDNNWRNINQESRICPM